jgi:hypothetical protein
VALKRPSRKRIIGASRLKRKLKRMPDLINEELKAVISEEANRLLTDVQAATPVSKMKRKKGHLRDAFEVKIAGDGLSARVGLLGKKKNREFFYGKFLEFGTKKIKKVGMFFRSWSKIRASVRLRVKDATEKALRKTAGWKASDA